MKIMPKDYIAILAIIGYFAGKLMGVDGQLDAGYFLILGYYFAHRKQGDDNGR